MDGLGLASSCLAFPRPPEGGGRGGGARRPRRRSASPRSPVPDPSPPARGASPADIGLMARDLTTETDRAIREGRALVRDNQAGGRHRRVRAQPIGRGSAERRRTHLMTRSKLIGGSLIAIVLAAMVAGLVIDGIGFTGIMIAFLAVVAATFLFSNYPKVKIPKRSDLNTGDARTLVARTELWLEHQRPALPPPAVTLVDQIGVQLDALGLQLEHVEPLHPAAVETRKLVGETLPGMIDAYRKVPAH